VSLLAHDIKVLVRIFNTRIYDWNLNMCQNPVLIVLRDIGENLIFFTMR